MALRTNAQLFLNVHVNKLPSERTSAGNARDLTYKNGGKGKDIVLRWAPHVARDKIMGNMKAFEDVEIESVKNTGSLNPTWANMERSLPEEIRIGMVINRVKDSEQIWILEIDTAKNVVVSAEVAAGSPW